MTSGNRLSRMEIGRPVLDLGCGASRLISAVVGRVAMIGRTHVCETMDGLAGQAVPLTEKSRIVPLLSRVFSENVHLTVAGPRPSTVSRHPNSAAADRRAPALLTNIL